MKLVAHLWVNHSFPELEYVYELLDEQLEYLAESVKNIIVVINDLIDAY